MTFTWMQTDSSSKDITFNWNPLDGVDGKVKLAQGGVSSW